eukprot:jgi/Mesvir1/16064/Mv08358-RA.1
MEPCMFPMEDITNVRMSRESERIATPSFVRRAVERAAGEAGEGADALRTLCRCEMCLDRLSVAFVPHTESASHSLRKPPCRLVAPYFRFCDQRTIVALVAGRLAADGAMNRPVYTPSWPAAFPDARRAPANMIRAAKDNAKLLKDLNERRLWLECTDLFATDEETSARRQELFSIRREIEMCDRTAALWDGPVAERVTMEAAMNRDAGAWKKAPSRRIRPTSVPGPARSPMAISGGASAIAPTRASEDAGETR